MPWTAAPDYKNHYCTEKGIPLRQGARLGPDGAMRSHQMRFALVTVCESVVTDHWPVTNHNAVNDTIGQ